MFLPLPLGIDCTLATHDIQIDVGVYLQRLARENVDWGNEPNIETLHARIQEISKFRNVAIDTGANLEADLPEELPQSVRRFLAFAALMTTLNCWIELMSASREDIGNEKATYSVTVAFRDRNGLFPSVMKQYTAIGLPFLAGDSDRELGGFFSAYIMAANSLVESAFLLPELGA